MPCKTVKNTTELFDFLHGYFEVVDQHDVCICGYSERVMYHDFTTFFTYKEAAGGLVFNMKGELLFIKRFGIWDLPKGKIEKNEEPMDAAIREVEEETGVTGLTVKGKLNNTCHLYLLKDRLVLKKTHWFRMDTRFAGELSPQLQEDITEAVWFGKDKSMVALKESYRSLYDTFMPYLQDTGIRK